MNLSLKKQVKVKSKKIGLNLIVYNSELCIWLHKMNYLSLNFSNTEIYIRYVVMLSEASYQEFGCLNNVLTIHSSKLRAVKVLAMRH